MGVVVFVVGSVCLRARVCVQSVVRVSGGTDAMTDAWLLDSAVLVTSGEIRMVVVVTNMQYSATKGHGTCAR